MGRSSLGAADTSITPAACSATRASAIRATVAMSLHTSIARTTSQVHLVLPRPLPGRSCAFSMIRETFLRLVTSRPCLSRSPSSSSSSLAPVAHATQLASWSNAGLASAASASSVVGSAASSRCTALSVAAPPSAPTAVRKRARPSRSPDSMTRCTPS